ncbi:CoA protein activase [Proteiniborus sp. MB09-C3]|uniref:CoA protein activase n=1 Tax=Proteiniborus sp. MB09-C3 TaxID=3050072 RepID=UPI002553C74B|nr:CoA protein activase [Proteiniborus sp. MB09-C3]WIV11327.1 CoA protein activase [Proteiniborus sp. MB09-C3]
MKITFPHMGNTYIAVKGLLEDLGNEVVLAPRCSKRTLELGTKYSPESICLPLKINIGNYIEAIEKGADTVIITGSCGPCRFGFYPVMEQALLKDLGYDARIIAFDPPDGKPMVLINRVAEAMNTSNPYKIIRSGKRAYKILCDADALTDLANKKRPIALNGYEVDMIMEEFYRDIEYTHGVQEILQLIKKSRERLDEIEIDAEKRPIKIGIIGEIYTIIEPFVNLDVEKKLGHLGAEVEKALTPSNWARHHIFSFPFGSKEEKGKWEAARPYLSTLVGGHGRETIGSAVQYAQSGFDGLVQIFPLTCMPEIVAESILPAIQRDYNIPILTLVVDEMTGEAGYLTRLEAFVDLLKKRREEKDIERMLLRG